MNKKAIYAVLLTLLLPLTCYFIIRYYSDKATSMPRHYLADSISTVVRNGKQVQDTVWHKLPNFALTNQMGETVTLDSLHGKILIADFFFTHCPTICPGLTQNMKTLELAFKNKERVGDLTNYDIHFLSFSIDPERDSVARLKGWADRFQINPAQWDLLTGPKKTIYDMALNDMKIGLVDGHGIDTSFIHTDHFVLIDTSGNIRGYYHGLDSASVEQLARDAVLLTLEKNPNAKNGLSGQLKTLAVAMLITAAAVGLFFILFKNKKNVAGGLEKK